MASVFIERAVNYLIYTIERDFESVASDVYDEYADGIVMRKPDIWLDTEIDQFVASHAQIEIWGEECSLPFTRERELTSIAVASGPKMLTSHISGVVKIRHCDSDGLGQYAVRRRSYRYGTIIARLIRNNVSSFYADSSGFIVPTSVSVRRETIIGEDEDERIQFFGTTLIQWFARQQESNAQEGFSGGGQLYDLSSLIRIG